MLKNDSKLFTIKNKTIPSSSPKGISALEIIKKIKIEKDNLRENSILSKTDYDYADSYKSEVMDNQNYINSLAIGKAFFSSSAR